MSNSIGDQLQKYLSDIERRVFDLVRELHEKDAHIAQLENDYEKRATNGGRSKKAGRFVLTTIASDGRTVAADGLETWGSEAVRRDRVKVRLGPGRVFAMSGTAAFFEPCIAWYMGGAKPDAAPEAKGDNTWGFCVFERDKVVYYSSTAPYPMEYPYPFTIGSGCDYAMGAMLHGATPREAVAIAASRNLNTGGVITEVEIPVALSEAAE